MMVKLCKSSELENLAALAVKDYYDRGMELTPTVVLSADLPRISIEGAHVFYDYEMEYFSPLPKLTFLVGLLL